ncbi:MAG: ankyrin repeat domain-containing protein [SAR324 cluster bacterium]|nr:ankyrin repeat domain-containing protein [SAR324 cluster bacterium]
MLTSSALKPPGFFGTPKNSFFGPTATMEPLGIPVLPEPPSESVPPQATPASRPTLEVPPQKNVGAGPLIALLLGGLGLLALVLTGYQPAVFEASEPPPAPIKLQAVPGAAAPLVAEPETAEPPQSEVPPATEEPSVSAPATLHAALLAEDHTALKRLLASGNSLEVRDAQHRTPLMRAVQLGDAVAAEHLLTHEADPDAADPFGDTSLTWAVVQRRMDLVNLLLQHRADPDKGHLTPLMWASLQNELPILERLLEAQPTINLRTREGWTVMHWAAEKGATEVMWRLLRSGAVVNAQDQSGRTALMLAARRGHLSTVRLLLERGALRDVEDFEGNTALDWAESEGRTTIADLLRP